MRGEEQRQEMPRPQRPSIIGRVIFLLICLLVAVIVLERTVFRLRSVYVVGNVTKSAESVAAASGLRVGDNMFTIDESAVEEGINSDVSMVFLRLEKDYPSTVYIYITERSNAATLQWLGMQYVIDAQGIVMSESNSLILPEGLPVVTGFQMTNIHKGMMIEVKDSRQLAAYRAVTSELKLQMFDDQVSEINVSSPESLYLMASCGITVKLGSSEHIRAKICAARTDLAYLVQLGKTSGVLDVSIPEDAKYTPE